MITINYLILKTVKQKTFCLFVDIFIRLKYIFNLINIKILKIYLNKILIYF